jgi:hypothetical protein
VREKGKLGRGGPLYPRHEPTVSATAAANTASASAPAAPAAWPDPDPVGGKQPEKRKLTEFAPIGEAPADERRRKLGPDAAAAHGATTPAAAAVVKREGGGASVHERASAVAVESGGGCSSKPARTEKADSAAAAGTKLPLLASAPAVDGGDGGSRILRRLEVKRESTDGDSRTRASVPNPMTGDTLDALKLNTH